jgi:hypothetical protein
MTGRATAGVWSGAVPAPLTLACAGWLRILKTESDPTLPLPSRTAEARLTPAPTPRGCRDCRSLPRRRSVRRGSHAVRPGLRRSRRTRASRTFGSAFPEGLAATLPRAWQRAGVPPTAPSCAATRPIWALTPELATSGAPCSAPARPTADRTKGPAIHSWPEPLHKRQKSPGKEAVHEQQGKYQQNGEWSILPGQRAPRPVAASGLSMRCQQSLPGAELDPGWLGSTSCHRVAVLCCCTRWPGFRIMSLTCGAKGIRTPDLLHAMRWNCSFQFLVASHSPL